MIDPSWPLSAVMQSTAALVAIVGGLVGSRLLSLAAERGALERQIAMLIGRMDQASREAGRLRSEMVAGDAAEAVDDWLDALLKSGKIRTWQWCAGILAIPTHRRRPGSTPPSRKQAPNLRSRSPRLDCAIHSVQSARRS